jgi:hypothetical protein
VNVDAQATPAASVPTAARSATAVTRLLALMNHPPWLQCTLAPIAPPRAASEEIRAQMEAEVLFGRRRWPRKPLRAVVARLLGRKGSPEGTGSISRGLEVLASGYLNQNEAGVPTGG